MSRPASQTEIYVTRPGGGLYRVAFPMPENVRLGLEANLANHWRGVISYLESAIDRHIANQAPAE